MLGLKLTMLVKGATELKSNLSIMIFEVICIICDENNFLIK